MQEALKQAEKAQEAELQRTLAVQASQWLVVVRFLSTAVQRVARLALLVSC